MSGFKGKKLIKRAGQVLGVPAAIYLVLVVVMCFGEAVRGGNQIDILSTFKTVFLALLPFLILLVVFELTAVQLWIRTGRFLLPGIITVLLLGGFILLQVRKDVPGNLPEPARWHEAPPGHMPPRKDMQGGPRMMPGPKGRPGEKNRPMSPEMMKSLLAVLLVMADFGIVYARTVEDERKRIAELEKEKISQELQYLRNQINPHFFMNTLNNIHSLVDIDPEKAKEVIVELSKLMRYVLYDGDQNLITYEKEANFLRQYVSLMSIRYSDSVKINLDFPEDMPGVMVPPLLLVNFVENAFKHGISYTSDSSIDISMRPSPSGGLVFDCSNKRHESRDNYGGIGMENVRKRLSLLYGSQYVLDIDKKPEDYHVHLEIPPTQTNTQV